MMLYLQDLPTQLWTEDEMDSLIAEAFVLRSWFEDVGTKK